MRKETNPEEPFSEDYEFSVVQFLGSLNLE